MSTKHPSGRRSTIRDSTTVINNDKVSDFPPARGPKTQILPKPVNLDSLGIIIKIIIRKAGNITSGLGVLKFIDVERELTNIKSFATIGCDDEGVEVLIRIERIYYQIISNIMPVHEEDHGPVYLLINIKWGV